MPPRRARRRAPLKYGHEEDDDDDEEEEEEEQEEMEREEEEEAEEEERKEEKQRAPSFPTASTASAAAAAIAEEKHTAPVTSASSSLPCDSEPRGQEGGEGGEGERESEEAREARRQLLRERDEGDPDAWRHVAVKERWPAGRVRTFDRLNRLLAQVRKESKRGVCCCSLALALPHKIQQREKIERRERER